VLPVVVLCRAFALCAALRLVSGCGTDDRHSADRHDAAMVDAAPMDAAAADAAPADAAPPDAGPLDEFPLRPLESHELPCPGGAMTFWDTDFVCRVPVDDTSIDLYVQATPTECVSVGMGDIPVFENVQGWYRTEGAGPAWPTDAAYDWGGNHHNEEIKFVFQDTVYDIWHSSLGFGWRACAPPDCLLTCAAGATFDTCDYLGGWVVDGCERVRPGGPPPPSRVLCVAVTASGEVPPFEDPWTTDPPLLPCPGDM